MHDEHNEVFKLAADLVNNTSRDLFLTGKAGTGKTTFLKYIRENTWKNVVVAAPTGVAAINAGGVTLHSLFQLPLQPYLPNGLANSDTKFFRMNKTKINLLRSIDLLIIDEVSMLRSDLLDAIDNTLRRYRRNNRPFGNVQILYIGDLFQLPPVVKEDEWDFLKEYYQSPFFFHAKVIEKQSLLCIELKKIYRQNDIHFIDLLNRLRNHDLQAHHIALLDKQYKPDFELSKNEGYITLSSHNYKADQINNDELENLKGKKYHFEGEIEGDFPENALPTDKDLFLKTGAQIMFIRNDNGDARRYYNGKLGIISQIKDNEIFVKLAESGNEIKIEQEICENIKYSYNKETGTISEEKLGSFKQYPIRLAWAITIHKSQGLTFDKVVIDAGQSFASGQVYVALSRCTSLEGIVLLSKLPIHTIPINPHILEFLAHENSIQNIQEVLLAEKPVFLTQCLLQTFDWEPLLYELYSFKNLIEDKQIPNKQEAQQLVFQLLAKAREQREVADKFKPQLQKIMQHYQLTQDITALKERVQKAAAYFYQAIFDDIISPIETHLNSFEKVTKIKQYLSAVADIRSAIILFSKQFLQIHYGDIDLIENTITPKTTESQATSQVKTSKVSRAQKGDSAKISFEMYKAGQSLAGIASERNLSLNTIEAHLTQHIAKGEISIFEIIPQEKVQTILAAIEQSENRTSLSPIKEQLGDAVSYGEIRMVMGHYWGLQDTKK